MIGVVSGGGGIDGDGGRNDRDDVRVRFMVRGCVVVVIAGGDGWRLW